eukprot:CAMPEP_0206224592 /NCGR_PEP_ID=MMETSP0047_2-20121206/7108_1 /ASSEMBLY_ACC=CAM_ASM_000192 /TAXON_ID=195065 /ORGANISM="Chroomonas mesostigmatica_cf, Strain CCMP1168" /LENGTH=69 /DNA_ID=CAMNT_0053647559 /DNA_START=1 /DNA_END=206 /DNA_ORIENTATION=+
MGVLLWMEPDYDTFECRFKFGAEPPSQQSDPVFASPCFTQCPSKAKRRHPTQPKAKDKEDLCPTLTPNA